MVIVSRPSNPRGTEVIEGYEPKVDAASHDLDLTALYL